MSDDILGEISSWFDSIGEWLPEAGQWLSDLLIGPIPKADEEAVYALADQWGALAEELNHSYEDIAKMANPILEAWSGDGAAAKFVEQWYSYLEGLSATATSAGQLEQGVQKFGLEIELMKFMAALNLIMLAVSIYLMIAAAIPTAGGSLAAAPGAFAATRIALQQAAEQAVSKIVQIVMRAAMKVLTQLFGKLAVTVGTKAAEIAARTALPTLFKALAGKLADNVLTDLARSIAARGISRTVANKLAADALRDAAGNTLRNQLAGQSVRAVQKELAKQIEKQLLKNWAGKQIRKGTENAIIKEIAETQAAKAALGKEFVKFVAPRVAFGAGFMGGGNLLGQTIQILEGHRAGIEWGQVGDNALQGAVFGGGMFGGVVGHTVGGALAGGGLTLGQELVDYAETGAPVNWTDVGHSAVQGAEAGMIFGGQARLEHATFGTGGLRIGDDVHVLPGKEGGFTVVSARGDEGAVITSDGHLGYQPPTGDRVLPEALQERPDVMGAVDTHWAPRDSVVTADPPVPSAVDTPTRHVDGSAPSRSEPSSSTSTPARNGRESGSGSASQRVVTGPDRGATGGDGGVTGADRGATDHDGDAGRPDSGSNGHDGAGRAEPADGAGRTEHEETGPARGGAEPVERAEVNAPTRTDPARTEPGRTEPGRAEPGRAEPGRAEPGRAEPGRAEPGRAEPGRTEPGRTEPGRTEPRRTADGDRTERESDRTRGPETVPHDAESARPEPRSDDSRPGRPRLEEVGDVGQRGEHVRTAASRPEGAVDPAARHDSTDSPRHDGTDGPGHDGADGPRHDGTATDPRGPDGAAGAHDAGDHRLESAGHELGEDPSPRSIEQGTVRFREHPDFPRIEQELRDLGVTFTESRTGPPSVSYTHVYDETGSRLIRVDRTMHVVEDMRFLDFEHEVGHVGQMEDVARFPDGPPATSAVKELPDGTRRPYRNAPDVIGGKIGTVEYHVRLQEVIRLLERGADRSIVDAHYRALGDYAADYDRVQRRDYSKPARWAREHFGDIPELRRRADDLYSRLEHTLETPARDPGRPHPAETPVDASDHRRLETAGHDNDVDPYGEGDGERLAKQPSGAEPARLVDVRLPSVHEPVVAPHDVSHVLSEEMTALVAGRERVAHDLPHRADWDAGAGALRIEYGDGTRVWVEVQVNESVPPGRAVVVRPGLEYVDGAWRQTTRGGVAISSHVPADPGARAAHVRESLDQAWRTLHGEVVDRLGPPPRDGGRPVEQPRSAEGVRPALDTTPQREVVVRDAAVVGRHEAHPADPTPARELTPDEVRQALTGRSTPDEVRGYAQEHLATRDATGSWRPRTSAEISDTVRRFAHEGLDRVTPPEHDTMGGHDGSSQHGPHPTDREVSQDSPVRHHEPRAGTSPGEQDAHWQDPAWLREGRGPAIDELIPVGHDEAERWGAAVAQEFEARLSHDFGDFRMGLDPDRHDPVSVYRRTVDVRLALHDTDGVLIGKVTRSFIREHDGSLTVHHNTFNVYAEGRGHGVSRRVNEFLREWYRESGVAYVEVRATKDGTYVWAREGFEWAPNNEHRVAPILAGIRMRVAEISRQLADLPGMSPDKVSALHRRYGGTTIPDLAQRMEHERDAGRAILSQAKTHPYGTAGFPTPKEIAEAGWDGRSGRDAHWIGKDAMLAADEWRGRMPISDGTVRHPRPDRDVTAAEVPESEFHGYAHPVARPETVAELAADALRGADPRFHVRVVAADTLPDRAVARTVRDSDGYRIEVSDRATDLSVPRAVAHELAEIRAAEARSAAGLELSGPDALRPDAPAGRPLSPHDHGRLAEIDHLLRVRADPAHRAGADRELAALRDHLGLTGDDPGVRARREVVADWLREHGHDPDTFSGGHPADEHAAAGRGTTKPPFDFEQFYRDPEWTAEAVAFEMRLGVHYFNDPETLHAARDAVSRLRDVLTELALRDVTDPGERAAVAAEVEKAFFRGDEGVFTSAGQVGLHVPLDALLRDGNVRELTTAFYNAAYFNRSSPHTLSRQLLDVIDRGHWDRAHAAGVDVRELRGMRDQLDRSPNRAVMSRVEALFPPESPRFARDVFATGNVIMRSDRAYRDLTEVVSSQARRQTRSPEVQGELASTAEHYERLGAPLGRYERAFIESIVGGPLEPGATLPWREGYVLHDIGVGVWSRGVARDGYPTLDGVSATTTRMLTGAKLIGLQGPRAEGFLHVLLGWMLPARDHSLFEMLRGAGMAGVEPVEFHSRSVRPTAIDLYRNIPGIDLHIIRTEIAPGGMLPHEARYLHHAHDPSGFSETQHKVPEIAARIAPQLSSGHVTDADLARWLTRNGIDPHDPAAVRRLGENLTEAHVMALSVYTRHSHYLINNAITAHMMSSGLSETVVRRVHDAKIADLVDNYLHKLEAGEKPLPLPLALRPVLHQGPGHLDSTSALRPAARRWIESSHDLDAAHRDMEHYRALGDKAAAKRASNVAVRAEEARDAARADIGRELKAIAPKLFDEVRWHADMVYDALMQLPAVGTPEQPVIAYRGDWTTPVWSPIYGSRLAPHGMALSVLSVSRLPEVAVRFMAENPASDNRILAVYRLTGVHARDISVFSSFPEDQEAVLPPGSKTRQVRDPALEAAVRDQLPPAWREKCRIIVLEERE